MCERYVLFSLLDMLKVKITPLLVCMDHLARSQAGVQSLAQLGPGAADHSVAAETVALTRAHLASLVPPAEDLGLKMTMAAVNRLMDRLQPHSMTIRQLGDALKDIQMRLVDEARATHLFAVDDAGVRYFEPARPLFGPVVHAAFPSARFDIEEAGKSHALDRHTAAAMHLMRAVEAPLRALGSRLALPNSPNWNQLLDRAERVIREDRHRPREEAAWMSQVASHFRFLKEARNDTMHAGREFTLGRARELFDTTGPFMRDVARQLEEPGSEELAAEARRLV